MRHTFTALHLAADENISWAARMPDHASARIICAGTDNLPPSLIRLDGSAFEIILVENAENGSDPAASGFK